MRGFVEDLYPKRDGDAPLAPSDIVYAWHIEQHNPYVSETISKHDRQCDSAEQAIGEVRGLLTYMAQGGWHIVQIAHYTWCCSAMLDGFVVVKFVTLEISSAAPN